MLIRILIEFLRNPARGAASLESLPDVLILSIGSLLLGLTVHEAAHGWVANRLGDPTAKLAGRVSLNPFRHLHPVGTMLLLVFGFGWGRPVPIDPMRLRFGPTKGSALVGLAGPVSNLTLAFVLSLPVRLGLVRWHSPLDYPLPFAFTDPGYVLSDVIGWLVLYNVFLAAFNLIPIAPLDGSRLLGFFLPASLFPWLIRFEAVGPILLAPLILGLLAVDLATGGARLFSLILPLANFVAMLAVGRPLSR